MTRRSIAIGVALIVALTGARAQAAADHYVLGVVPQLTKLELHRLWTPLVDYLQERLGASIELHLYDSIPEFELGFLTGKADFVYLNPYHAVLAHDAQGYVPVLRDSSRGLVGILVVRRDSTFRTAQDLDGQVISFPSPNAYAASLYMRLLLAERERIGFVAHYDGSHSNTLRQVLLGFAAAGGAVAGTLERQRPEVQQGLRVLYETSDTPAHPLVVHPRVPEAVRRQVLDAFMALRDQPGGPALLEGISVPQPVAADYVRDYQPLTELGLERYAVVPTFEAPEP